MTSRSTYTYIVDLNLLCSTPSFNMILASASEQEEFLRIFTIIVYGHSHHLRHLDKIMYCFKYNLALICQVVLEMFENDGYIYTLVYIVLIYLYILSLRSGTDNPLNSEFSINILAILIKSSSNGN